MYISVIGATRCGKTTLFQALSGIMPSPSATTCAIATIDVPDERLDRLSEIFKPKKTVHARVELTDTVPIEEGELKNETISPKVLIQMRSSDAFILVLRQFDNGLPPDPVAEFRNIYSEFMLSDMVQIEKRLERIRKQGVKKDGTALLQEKSLLEQCFSHLEDGKALCTLPLPESEDKPLRGFEFLSRKPMMVVLNCGEEMVGHTEKLLEEIRPAVPADIPIIAACARLEADLALMPQEERAEFMAEYGITETIRGRIVRLATETLGLIFFLTVGEDECRAWPIKRGTTAQEAAGTIHTDFFNKFIRAETVAYDDFVAHKGFEGCKKAGLWRLEGKTYMVHDGDIMTIRAGN
jgi:ribosome-binding ATPase